MEVRKRDYLLLLLREGPRKYTELRQETNMSFDGLTKALRRLEEEGYIQKLRDGRYALTEKGVKRIEEMDVLFLSQEVIRLAGAEAVKKSLEALLRRLEERSMEVMIAELLIRTLRAYMAVTKGEKGWWQRRSVNAEEKRAVEIIHTALEELGGEEWYERFATFLDESELTRIRMAKKREDRVWWLPAPLLTRERALRIAEAELARISLINVELPETLREAVNTLLSITKERMERLKEGKE